LGAVATVLVAMGSPAGAQAQTSPDGLRAGSGDVTATERVQATKAPSSRLAQTDRQLLARNDAAPVNVMVKLDYDAAAAYQGGLPELEATSPSTTGAPLTRGRMAEYEEYVAGLESQFVRDLQAAVPGARVVDSLRIVYGGVAARIPANAVETVLDIDGVVAVQENTVEQLLTDSSPEFVNAPPAYDVLGSTANAGEGTILGNLDSGVWPEHPSFADLGNLDAPPGPARECSFGDNPLTPEADPFQCNNKLIGGAAFTEAYDACAADGRCLPDPYTGTARDGNGHGTHTSTTSAGNIVEEVETLGRPLPAIHGLAPGAWVMSYKVCGPSGSCFASDSAAAVGQAILDGVDVINFSIGGGQQPFSDPVELAFLDAYAAGVFVSASAGNSGPGASTAGHLGPWVTTVGASTQTREFATTLTLTAGNGDTFTADGASITPGVAETPVVLARDFPGYEDESCGTEPSSPTLFDGFIIACERGGQARVWKGFVVFSGGGEGMVLYNPALQDVETDNHWLPTVHLPDGTDFVAFMDSHTDVTGSFPQGEARDGQGDVMAAFSSRGPGGLVIKPDLTAPGVQILAGETPTPPEPTPDEGGPPPGNFYQAIAGTSMSSPHVAGAALLVRAVHPDWTPGQIRSALMTTSITDVLKEDLETPADPFDFGAGRIDIGEAIFAPLTIDETAERFFAMGNDPVQAVHLNLPSVNAPVMPGRLTTTRVVTNASGLTERFEVTTDAPEDSTITVRPRNFRLPPGGSVTLTITIESDAPVDEQRFGTILLNSRAGQQLHLPVAFIHTQGSANLSQSCSPATVQVGGQSTCQVEAANNSFEDQVVNLDTEVSRNLRVLSVEGAAMIDRRHVQLHGVTLAGAQPGVPSVDPGASPAGYLPLDEFGGTIQEPIGDEEIINFTVPPFEFAGATWAEVGVDSNGYLIVGGGAADDNNCCELPDGPDPARPNNMLAPLWSDLDGTNGEGILVNILTDGVNDWLVFEYRVTDFGGTEPRIFQVWIGLNGTEDISYTYDPENLPSDLAWPFLVGAENQLGEGDMEAVLPTGDLRVTSTDPTPGDTVSYSLTVRGTEAGVGQVTTEMEASRTPGVTIVETEIRVIQRPSGSAVPM
jgi:hypothetical protein